MIVRTLQQRIEGHLFKGKAIVVTGARQVGKSTLFKQTISGRAEEVLSLNCDEPEVKEMLVAQSPKRREDTYSVGWII